MLPASGECGGFRATASTRATSAALGSGAAEQQASTGPSLLVGADVPLVGSAATLAALRFIFSLQVQVKRHPQATLNRCCRMIVLATSTTAAAPATVPATTIERCCNVVIPQTLRFAGGKASVEGC